MWEFAVSVAIQCVTMIKDAILVLLPAAEIFIVLAVLTKGLIPAWAAAKRAVHETRINLTIYILDAVTVGPLLVAAFVLMAKLVDAIGLRLIEPATWNSLPYVFVGLAVVFIGDFIGYWRHRLEHTRLLWPSHAVHHSDTAMTWLALLRFHPINRLTTFVVDNSILLLLGFPDYALLVYAVVKHYYGFFIHADLPWTYGRLDYVFVSPIMHRWHHSIEPEAYGTNFATVFSFFDRVFGTYHVPGLHHGQLGVRSDIGPGVLAQLLYPFRRGAYRAARSSSTADLPGSTRPGMKKRSNEQQFPIYHSPGKALVPMQD